VVYLRLSEVQLRLEVYLRVEVDLQLVEEKQRLEV
jgi:hypothetical protein